MEIVQTGYNLDKETLYMDEPFYKKVDSQGNLVHLTNSDALAQALKLWITSGQGEKVRSTSGGILVPHLGKAMDNDRANKIKNSIIKGLASDFSPSITITNLQVIPNYAKNQWVIILTGYTTSLEVGVNTSIVINNSSS
jgi:hypothetical protein